MKPGKLYIKIFLSFLLVLLVTEVLIFGFFLIAVGKVFRPRFEKYTTASVSILKEALEDRIKADPDTPVSENPLLKDFLNRHGSAIDARVWMAEEDGKPLLRSFEGPLPHGLDALKRRETKTFGGIEYYHTGRGPHAFYGTIPIRLGQGRTGRLHVYFDEEDPSHEEKKGFALGLASIGGVIALLLIPVSRKITGPIKSLNLSALQVADGDLSHRATVKSRDEIGELGRSFNFMTDKLERMIRGGKELTANVSHELRSPLARIRVAEELLREELEKGRYTNLDRHLQDIREDIEELDHLIGRILDLSKLDLKEEKLKFVPVDVGDMLRELLDRFNPVMVQKSLEVQTDLSVEGTVMGDRDALLSALTNVLDNAVKFSPDGGMLRVSARRGKNHLAITISNTHDPLAEEDLARLFDPFFRGEEPEKTGSGLGMAITKKAVERHHGTIEAYNSAEGLAIRIRLPVEGSAPTSS